MLSKIKKFQIAKINWLLIGGLIFILVFIVFLIRYYYHTTFVDKNVLIMYNNNKSPLIGYLENYGIDRKTLDNQTTFYNRPDGYFINNYNQIQLRPNFKTTAMTLFFAVYVNNFQDQSISTLNQTIFLTQGDKQVVIAYNPSSNNLIINITMHYIDNNQNDQNTQEIILTNLFRLQKWELVTIVINNRYFDLYLNGNLHHSIILHNIPILNPHYFNLLPGKKLFYGKLTCVQFFQYALDAKNIHDLSHLYMKNTVPYIPLRWIAYLKKNN